MFQAGAHSSTPSHFPLIYGQGDFFDILNPQRLFVLGHAAAAMFLPSGHTAAQAAAMGSLQVHTLTEILHKSNLSRNTNVPFFPDIFSLKVFFS